MKVSRFEDLECRQVARELTQSIYRQTTDGKFSRDHSLRDQMQRAGLSIMANIAEGFMRRSDKEFVQYLYTAMASSAEVQSHLYVALDAGYMTKDEFRSLYEQAGTTGRLISGLIKYLRSPHQNPRTKATEQTEQTEQTRQTSP
jgi:four helix bundle protein